MKVTEELNHSISKLSGKTIIITGAGGMLGLAFKNLISEHIDCNLLALTHQDLDITDSNSVMKLVEKNPDLIIHCAAKVDANFCEDNVNFSYENIVNGTKNIINLAKETGAKFFYPQSFLIFDGLLNPVDENTLPNPLSVYGKHKFQAEKEIIENLPNALVVRMGGFFGGYEKDKNFAGKFILHLIHLLKKGQPSQEVGDRVWQPTFTNDLAYNVLLLLAKDKCGVYNMASQGEASFYDLATEIVNYFKINDKIKILPVSAEEFKRKESALRPRRCILTNQRLNEEGLNIQRGWKESLHDYLNNNYFKELFNFDSILLKPFQSKYLGQLKNRVVMSPMSRGLADENHCCTLKVQEYFIERARKGIALMFAGGMIVHPTGDGYNNSLHMWNKLHSNS